MHTELAAVNLRLSALERSARDPQAVLLALHGGGYSAGYWDMSGASLLEAAAEKGFRAIAIDRPGYGAAIEDIRTIPEQADVILELADTLSAECGGVPVFLTGHSMGGILALHTAARAAGTPIRAVDAQGVPLRFPQAMQDALKARALPSGETHFPAHDGPTARAVFFGPDGSFPASALERHSLLSRPVPGAEIPGAANAPEELPAIMRQIRIPVRLTFAAHEASSVVDETVLAAARADLSGTGPGTVVRTEPGCGHNISLHHGASAFHEGMLVWFAELLEHG